MAPQTLLFLLFARLLPCFLVCLFGRTSFYFLPPNNAHRSFCECQTTKKKEEKKVCVYVCARTRVCVRVCACVRACVLCCVVVVAAAAAAVVVVDVVWFLWCLFCFYFLLVIDHIPVNS